MTQVNYNTLRELLEAEYSGVRFNDDTASMMYPLPVGAEEDLTVTLGDLSLKMLHAEVHRFCGRGGFELAGGTPENPMYRNGDVVRTYNLNPITLKGKPAAYVTLFKLDFSKPVSQ